MQTQEPKAWTALNDGITKLNKLFKIVPGKDEAMTSFTK